jgi:predicted O-methyltransferase YrrM
MLRRLRHWYGEMTKPRKPSYELKTDFDRLMWSLEQRRGDMWNLSRDAGQFVNILTRTTGTKRILEVGGSNGYSAIWFSLGLPDDGKIITLEMDAKRAAEARENWKKAGVAHKIQQILGDANQILPTLEGPFDLVLLDAVKEDYLSQFKIIYPKLKSGGLVLADNAIGHAKQMQDYLDYVRHHPDLDSVLIPIGDGMELTYKKV